MATQTAKFIYNGKELLRSLPRDENWQAVEPFFAARGEPLNRWVAEFGPIVRYELDDLGLTSFTFRVCNDRGNVYSFEVPIADIVFGRMYPDVYVAIHQEFGDVKILGKNPVIADGGVWSCRIELDGRETYVAGLGRKVSVREYVKDLLSEFCEEAVKIEAEENYRTEMDITYNPPALGFDRD